MKCLVALFAATVVAGTAEARSALQCNKKQTKCLTENTRLSIGDQVGIFNDDGELVAKGEVTAMRGEKRALKIDRRHGKIHKGYSLALLDSDKAFETNNSLTSYSVYRAPADGTIGASIGLGNVSIGDSSPATEYSAFGGWRLFGESSQIILRGVFQSTEGEVSRYGEGDESLEIAPVSMSGIGAVGGFAYTFFRQKALSLRGEIAAGAMHVSATVDGDAGLVQGSGYNTHIKNGLQPYGRTSMGVLLNFDTWHLSGDLAMSLVSEAYTKALSAGLSKDLR
jgi:hypothetical protein